MTLEQAINGATKDAKQHKVAIVVVHAPIEHAEENTGEPNTGAFGYCPLPAVRTLYPTLGESAAIVQTVMPPN